MSQLITYPVQAPLNPSLLVLNKTGADILYTYEVHDDVNSIEVWRSTIPKQDKHSSGAG